MLSKSKVITTTALTGLWLATGAAMAQDFSGQTLIVGTWGGDIERLLKEHAAKPLEEKDPARRSSSCWADRATGWPRSMPNARTPRWT